MRALLRDRDFMMVLGCLAVGLLQVRAQRALLRALEQAAARQAAAATSGTGPRTLPQPMQYDHPGAAEAARRFGVDHGMN